MKKIIRIIILPLMFSIPVFSQEPAGSLSDTINLEEVVITGSMIRVDRNNIPMAVSIVNREQLAESTESNLLPILNGRVPGLFVTERGVTGFGVAQNAAGQITMRGIGGSPTTGVLVLIDGHPQFMGIFGHPLSDSYVASDVERVEVIRGPGSILYGSNAMGGVVNIITRRQPQEGLHGNARLMLGSYGTQKYMLSGGFRKNRLSVFASLNHDETGGHRPKSDFNINNAYFKVDYGLSDNFGINTDFNITGFKTSDPGPDTTNAFPGNKLKITRGYWSFAIDNDFEKFSGSAKFYYNFGEHFISNAFSLPVEGGFHSNDNNYGVNIYESAKLFKGNNITIGADYARYGGKAENIQFNASLIDTVVYETGVYGFIQQSLFDKLTLNAGMRFQNHNVYGNIAIPSGGFAFNLTPATTWKASLSKGFRSPTVQELFLFPPHNPDLNPEQVWNYETGIHQSFFEKKLNLELTGFIVNGESMIVFVPVQGILQNAGDIDNKGIEFALNASLKDAAFNVTYSYIDMANGPVYATPKSHLFISGRYNLNRLGFMASIENIDELDTNPSPAFSSLQSYTLVNAKVNYNFWGTAEIFVSGKNLFDTEYETLTFYTMPGITVFGGLNFSF
jgi:iron complex outermembrane receptor protein